MYTLQIWDTAGQERFKSLRTPFYRGSDICLLTYAVDDRASFRNLALWRNEFLYYADVKEGPSFPFLVVGNKVDMSPDQHEVSVDEARAWCQENGAPPHVETSAKDATNVEEAVFVGSTELGQVGGKARPTLCWRHCGPAKATARTTIVMLLVSGRY
ncbi:unnamed protein product [Timema podura]|uniref:Uncharacterized protein n=1 Tax=Timema podura TaxID=61482 RepID=A0ABN7P3E5_TIMPD|nr:unnamed protein product [Timema podura]